MEWRRLLLVLCCEGIIFFIRKLVLLVGGSVLRDVKCWTSQV